MSPELIPALLNVLKVSAEQNIIIDSICLPDYWTSEPEEIVPVELLGVKILN